MEKQNGKFKQKKLKGVRGITLIALVITIVVLLILAAVSIATLTGDNGILTKAKTAETTNKEAKAEEEMKLLLADWQLEKRSNSDADLGDFLNSKKAKGELDNVIDNEDGSYTIERSGYETTISDEDRLGELGKIEPEIPLEGLQRGEIAKTTEKDNYTDENGDKATVPEGFKVSDKKEGKKYTEDKVNDGLVVIAPDGSEFVWVPVPKAIYSQSPSEPVGNITEKAMSVRVSETDYRGILYNFNVSGDNTSSSAITGCTTTNFTKNADYREPAVLKYSSGNIDDSVEGITLENLQLEYKKMLDQVEKYKGFYVGRYETSIIESNVASKEEVSPMTAETTSGNKWYGMYNKQKNYASNVEIPENSKKLNDVVGSSMIWGSQYDAMLNWILTGADKSKVTEASTKYQGKTGTSNDVMNKIYDLGSNLQEWTLEAEGSFNRICRGGWFSANFPPSYRFDMCAPPSTYNSVGSRITLYII